MITLTYTYEELMRDAAGMYAAGHLATDEFPGMMERLCHEAVRCK